jgi:plastin-1
VSNTNYVVVIGKQLKFSLVNIAGIDIVNGNKKLILALVWQMMRSHTLKFLAEVQKKKFGGKEVTDEMIIKWSNDKIAAAGRSSKITSYKDRSLATGVFFMDLLFSIEPRIIDWDFVSAGESDEEKLLNAKYAISVARKLGAVIFLLPEDIGQ